jgi:hypothetical protein
MARKSPIFLLEIVIAIFLVGLFSVYFLRSSIHYLYQERRALLDLEFERQYNLQRMELIAQHWNMADRLPTKESEAKEWPQPFTATIGGKSYSKTKKYKVWCAGKHENHFNLVLQEDRIKYHFLVKKDKSEAKA